MTRLPGRDVLAPPDLDAYLDGLARTLHAIHDDAGCPGTLNYYRPWGLDTVTEPPPWSRRPRRVGARDRDRERTGARARPRAVHRDFHPGNVLWQRGHVSAASSTGPTTCRGPAAADVAHCRLNLALLFGLDAADDFARRYGAVADLAWHDIADVVGWAAPGRRKRGAGTTRAGPTSPTEDICRARRASWPPRSSSADQSR